MWGSWLTSVGFKPQHISPVVDVEEKDAAGSWLIVFFLFFSLWSFVTSVLTFSSHKLFFKTYLSVNFVLLSINRHCVLGASSVQRSGLH